MTIAVLDCEVSTNQVTEYRIELSSEDKHEYEEAKKAMKAKANVISGAENDDCLSESAKKHAIRSEERASRIGFSHN